MNRFYYTLADLWSGEPGSNPYNNPWDIEDTRDPETGDYTVGLWKVIGDICGFDVEEDDNLTIELFSEYLWWDIWNSYLGYVDSYKNEWDVYLRAEAANDFFPSVVKWLRETHEKYQALIGEYNGFNDNEGLIPHELGTESFNRFNDTPQTGTSGLDSDGHATTTNKTTSKVQLADPVAALREFEKFKKSYMKMWAQEFIDKFVICK